MERQGNVVDFRKWQEKTIENEGIRSRNKMREQVMLYYHIGGMEALEELVRVGINGVEKNGKNRVAAAWVFLSDIREWLGDDVVDKLTELLHDIIGQDNHFKRRQYSTEDVEQAATVFRAAMQGNIQIDKCPPNEKLFVLNNIAVFAAVKDENVITVQKQTPIGFDHGLIAIKDRVTLGIAKNAIAFLMRYADEVKAYASFSNSGVPILVYEFRANKTNEN